MTVMESQALTDLLARAGASDADYELWQAERAQGVTATQVRDLYIGAVRQQDLIDIKLGRKRDPFVATKYTEWGNTRESVIADLVEFGHDITPEHRVFHAADNSRFLASPDGVGAQRDGSLLISEYKTSKYAIPVEAEKFTKTGYRAQMVWGMRVTGARRCLYRWEQHNDDWRDVGKRFPEPSGITASDEHWVEYDEALAAELEAIAVAFLAELDRQREEGAPAIDEDLDTHAVNYLRAIDEEKRWGDLKREHYAAVVAAGKSQESPLARVTYTAEKPGEVLEVEEIDYDAARATHFGQALFAELQSVTARWNEHLQEFISTKSVQGKGRAASARITAGKATKEQKA